MNFQMFNEFQIQKFQSDLKLKYQNILVCSNNSFHEKNNSHFYVFSSVLSSD